MRILVIDDDENLIRVVRQYLESDGYVVLGSQDAHEAISYILDWHPDLILLDIVMPDMDGRQLCQRVRGISRVPIVFLSGLDSELDIVAALGAGADEYITKPPRANELRARVRALLRRGPVPTSARNYADSFLVIDIAARRVHAQGERVELSPLEFRLLAYLVARRGQLLSHQELIAGVWGTDGDETVTKLHLYIHNLRNKLEPDPSQPIYLLNRFGQGYSFEPHDLPLP